MREIGGYFSSESLTREELNYHSGLLELNSGRSCLEYIILANGLTKIYLPSYSCAVLLEPIIRCGIRYEYYSINANLEPVFDFSIVGKHEAVLLINYFGLLEDYLSDILMRHKGIIIDNSQAFFSRTYGDVGTFYSARKFFGVSDGAFAAVRDKLNRKIPQDSSKYATEFPEIRRKSGASAGYSAFLLNEQNLSHAPMMVMSERTKNVLLHLDFESIIKTRRANYQFFNERFCTINQLNSVCSGHGVPMCYPLLLRENVLEIKGKLARNNIFIPTYWPDISVENNSFEQMMVNNLLCLPIDHRYSTVDLELVFESLSALVNL